MSTIHRPTAKSLALITILAAACFAQTKEYIRLGGRVIAIEGGLGLTIVEQPVNLGTGQEADFVISVTNEAASVSCNVTAGTCIETAPNSRRFTFKAPATGNNVSVTTTFVATRGAEIAQKSASVNIFSVRMDLIQFRITRTSPASTPLRPGETVTVTAKIQTANSQMATNRTLEATNFLGVGATFGPPQVTFNAGTTEISRDYTAPPGLFQEGEEFFTASFAATAPPLPNTISANTKLKVSRLTIDNVPSSLCLVSPQLISPTTNLVNYKFRWELNGATQTPDSQSYSVPVVGGQLKVYSVFGTQLVARDPLTVTLNTAGCTLSVVPAFVSMGSRADPTIRRESDAATRLYLGHYRWIYHTNRPLHGPTGPTDRDSCHDLPQIRAFIYLTHPSDRR